MNLDPRPFPEFEMFDQYARLSRQIDALAECLVLLSQEVMHLHLHEIRNTVQHEGCSLKAHQELVNILHGEDLV